MKKGIKRSIFTLLSVVLAAVVVLAGCGNTGSKAKLADQQVFRMNLGTEPPSLDPALAKDNVSFTVLWAAYEGLTKVGGDGKVVPGVAKKWDISADGLTYTFHLRNDVKWSNGDTVTAKDFEYAWKRALKPEMASEYAYILYYVKNAEAYNSGEITDVSQVGVQAKDDTTLVVTLENPSPYFADLTSFVTYLPLNEKAVGSNDTWSSESSTMVTNGAFNIDSWKHSDTLVLKRNDSYYDAKNIKLQEIRMAMIEEETTAANMYDNNELDWNGTPTGAIPLDMIPALKAAGELTIQSQASIYYYLFNVTKKPFNNAKVRKAFSMAIDRKAIVDNVTQANQLPAYGMVTPGIKGEKSTFREEHDQNTLFKEDYAEAKKLLAEGLAEEGIDKAPTFTLTYNTSEGHKKIAQAIGDMWKTNLGIDIKLENQEWGVFLDTRHNLQYEIARAGWIADYDDPNSFLDMFMSDNQNNDSGYKNPAYDKLLKDAMTELNAKKRMDLLNQAEKMLIQDDMVVMPIYDYSSVFRHKDNVQDITIDYQGNIHFNYGFISK